MTVETVLTTTPVLYHNHHYYCCYYYHLVSLCLPRNIDYIQYIQCCASSSVCIARRRAARAACCCCCCCFSSRLLLPADSTLALSPSRVSSHTLVLAICSVFRSHIPWSRASAGWGSHEKHPCMNASLLLRRPHPSASVSLNHSDGNADPT